MSATGLMLGKYHVGDELGRGGFATVYRATDTTLQREVALKVLHPQLLFEPRVVELFRAEARTVASLEHPNIVPIYDVGEVDTRLYIAMKLIRGHSLTRVIGERGRLPWAEALALIAPVCAALDYAHEQGVTHRDLKPSNILLDQRGSAFLNDFGFARAIAETTVGHSGSADRLIGTPGYIAPELWDHGAATPASDVYSLACVLYEMLTGQMLFAGSTPYRVIKSHLEGPQFPARWPDDVPPGLAPVLLKALSRDPKQRHQSASALLAELQALSATGATVAVRPPPVGPESPPGPQPGSEPTAPARRQGCSVQANIVVALAVAGLALLGGLTFLIPGVRGGVGMAAVTAQAATGTANLDATQRAAQTATNPAGGVLPEDQAATATAVAILIQATEAADRATAIAAGVEGTAGAILAATATADALLFQQATADAATALAEAEQATASAATALAAIEQATAFAATAAAEQAAAATATAAAEQALQAEQSTAAAIAQATAEAGRAAARQTAAAAERQTAQAQPTRPPPPPPTSTPAGSGDTRTSSRGDVFAGSASEAGNFGQAGCIVGKVKDVNGGNFTSFYVQVDNRGRTVPATHDYNAGEYAVCGLQPGVWGVAVYAVNNVPTGGEAAAHQIRVQLTGQAGQVWYVNFRGLRAFP